MNVIKFAKEDHVRDSGYKYPVVALYVDERPLIEIIRDVELPMAVAEGEESLAGQYAPLTMPKDPGNYFLDRYALKWGTTGDKTMLMECDCCVDTCWPLLCKIEVGSNSVRWNRFEQPHRVVVSFWDYAGFAGFEFSKEQYVRALGTLIAQA